MELGRCLIVVLRAGDTAVGDRRAIAATSVALQINGDVVFSLLDLWVDFSDYAAQYFTEIYERSQHLWIQQWLDKMVDFSVLNRLVA